MYGNLNKSMIRVAPHAGAWIETIPLIVKGLTKKVAPHAGAWIETYGVDDLLQYVACRTPRGCVD